MIDIKLFIIKIFIYYSFDSESIFKSPISFNYEQLLEGNLLFL